MTTLIVLGTSASLFRTFPDWPIVFVPDTDTGLAVAIKCADEDVLLCAANLLPFLNSDTVSVAASRCDFSHAGLRLGGQKFLTDLQMTSTNWFFLNPHADRTCVSWKATPTLCWLRPAVIRGIGGFDPAYESATAKLMDAAYRVLLMGGRVWHTPDWLPSPLPFRESSTVMPLSDELIFAMRHVGNWAPFWIGLWRIIQKHQNPLRVSRTIMRARRRGRQMPPLSKQHDTTLEFGLRGSPQRSSVTAISAIIPTLNRYEHVLGSIDSLLKQAPPVDEIIIVDQTPKPERQVAVYEPYSDNSRVKLIFLDEAGQSLSRNIAILSAKHEWLLLFEDDTEAWDGMLAEHINAIEKTGAHGSTGISLAPWKTIGHIPMHNRHMHIASVLATGNCLIRKDAVTHVGGLNRAYDRGPGADHDLGVRLYLSGFEIVLNPKAIQTHHKAPSGGMRTHNVWWRTTTSLWGPYPPPTQIYMIQQYYDRSFHWPLYVLYFLYALRNKSWGFRLWLLLSAPLKLRIAFCRTRNLVTGFLSQEN